jgi:2'-5' RNA ligase
MAVLPLSLWLEPAPSDAERQLRSLIQRLAREHQTPHFPPHVTIVSGFNADEGESRVRLREAADLLPAQELVFTNFGHEQVFYRSLYLITTPTARLQAAHDRAATLWAVEGDPYMPHLSLQYSYFTNDHKRIIIDSLDIDLPVQVRFDRLTLWCTDSELDVTRWFQVDEMPLT